MSRAPNAPASTLSSTSRSSSGVETSKSSRSDRWLASISAPARREVAGRERRGEGLDPRVLGHDVAGERIVGDLLDRRVAQRRDAEARGRGLARARAARRRRSSASRRSSPLWITSTPTAGGIATGVIASVRQSSSSACPARPPTDASWSMTPHGTPLASCSTSCADERELDRVEAQRRPRSRSRSRSATVERRARRQPRADRHGRRDRGVEARRTGRAARAGTIRRDRSR